MNNLVKVAVATSAFVAAASSSTAAPIYADTVAGNGQVCETAANDGNSENICNTLGAPDSSANGGVADIGEGLIFSFDDLFNQARLFFLDRPVIDLDIVFGTRDTETVTVSGEDAVADGSGRFVIEVLVAGLFDSLSVLPSAQTTPPVAVASLQAGPVVSTFAATTTPDAQLDAVSVSIAPVPVPASAALMLVGVGALGAMRRRKSA